MFNMTSQWFYSITKSYLHVIYDDNAVNNDKDSEGSPIVRMTCNYIIETNISNRSTFYKQLSHMLFVVCCHVQWCDGRFSINIIV